MVKIISENIAVHASFVGCSFGKIPVNEFHIVKRRLPNLKTTFAIVSFAERLYNTSGKVSDAPAGAIVLTLKVVHTSF